MVSPSPRRSSQTEPGHPASGAHFAGCLALRARWSAVSLDVLASADAKIGYLMQPAHHKVLTQIRRLERFINGWKMIPATAVRRNRVFLALISKALTVGRAICVLAKTGFGAEAFGLSRTLIDVYFSVRYMSNKDTEARVDTYADYEARVHKEWVRIYTKYYPAAALKYPPPSQPEIMKLAEKYPSKHQWSGLGGQAKFMALEPDSFETNELGQPITSEFDYEAQYSWTSHFVHVTVKALEGHATPPGDVFRIRSDASQDKDYARLALINTLTFLDKTFIQACRAMREEQPDGILRDMLKLVRKMGRKRKQRFSI
jgi:Family of unknown function (DUF5677)